MADASERALISLLRQQRDTALALLEDFGAVVLPVIPNEAVPLLRDGDLHAANRLLEMSGFDERQMTIEGLEDPDDL